MDTSYKNFNDIKKLIVDVNRNNKRLNVNSQTIRFLYCYYKLLENKNVLNNKGKIKNNEMYSFTKNLIDMMKTIKIEKPEYKLLNVDLYNASSFVKMKMKKDKNLRYIADMSNNKYYTYYYLYVYSKMIYEQEKTTCYPVHKDEIKNNSIKDLQKKYKYIHVQDPIKQETKKFLYAYLPKEHITKRIDKEYLLELKEKAYKNNNINVETIMYKFLKSNYYKALKDIIVFKNYNAKMILYNKNNIDKKINQLISLVECE